MPTYNILALDGGGSWAILQAQALAQLYGYDTPGQSILARFTLAAANSGGSIILAGLALNFTPRDLITNLNQLQLRQNIFVPNPNLTTFLGLGLEKYQAAAKLQGLINIMQTAPAGAKCSQPLDQIGSPCRLLIPAFNYDRQRAEFFRSDPNSPAASVQGCPQPTLAEAVHASTNAPIKFFNAPAQFATPAYSGCRYWDGCMAGLNNPVLAAVTEAMAYGYAATDLRILSIGTASVFLPMPSPLPAPDSPGQNGLCVQIQSSGLIHDATEILPTLILDDPPDESSFIAHVIVSGPAVLSQDPANPTTNGNLVRLNPWIQPVSGPGGWVVPSLLAYAPDLTMSPPNSVTMNYPGDLGVFNALVNLEMDAVAQADVDLITTLGRSWIAGATPNQSIRTTPDMKPLIGHGTFGAGAAQAKVLGLTP
jgi:uncharacterized protein